MKERDLILRDKLAIERTKMANERTFLAYFRSSIFFLGTGVSIVEIHFFREIDIMGWIFVGISPVIFTIGFFRLNKVKKSIRKMIEESDK